MAPNRKQLNLLTTSFADIEVVQPKYLPLTHPSEQAQQTVPKSSSQTSEALASYWDWEADVPEEPKDLFSATAIEANLIKDSQRKPSAEIIRADDASEHDSYWDEAVTTATKPQHDSYWSWPAKPESAIIQSVLEEEAAFQNVSTDRLVKNLLNNRRAGGKSQRNPSNDSYWEWDSPITNKALDDAYSQAYWEWKSDVPSKPATANKAKIISDLLDREACRQVLSLERLEENLKKFRPSDACATQVTSDSYWNWSTVEDNYWDMAAQPVVTEKGYWDW